MRDITRRFGAINLHLNRGFQYFVGQMQDITRHGCREQKRLAFCRYVLDDPSDIGQKSHVEHPVCLVQYEHFQMRQVDVCPD